MTESLAIKDFNATKKTLYQWANEFNPCIILDSCEFNTLIPGCENPVKNKKWESCIAVGNEKLFSSKTNDFSSINNFIQDCNSYLFGHINYDAKNIFEKLTSKNLIEIPFPEYYFFKPEIFIFLYKTHLEITIYANKYKNVNVISEIQKLIDKTCISKTFRANINFTSNLNRNEYINRVNELKKEIAYGNIYEINYCMNFNASVSLVNPIDIYIALTGKIPSPFSAYYKLDQNYLLSFSPERFIKKTGSKIYSQPMKGTVKRGANQKEDENLKKQLYTNAKERSENIMTVDLVRNDITRCAIPQSVKVEELCGIYTFKYVHQMISTISGDLATPYDMYNIIKNTFPMGSMTGAPKIKAMKLIEQYENFKRGIFSGTVGYITPNLDFDFNVIIRSILYNETAKRISVPAGSAITHYANAEDEYTEIKLKADAIIQSFLNLLTN